MPIDQGDRRRQARARSRRAARPAPACTGRLIWVREERHAEDDEDAADGRVGEDATHRAERELDDTSLRHDLGPDLARPERDEEGRPDRQRRRQPEHRRERPAEAIDEDAGEDRTDAQARSADDAPKMPMIVPRRRLGVTSRMPASITPVLPELEPDEQHAAARAATAPVTGPRPRTRPPRRARSGRSRPCGCTCRPRRPTAARAACRRRRSTTLNRPTKASRSASGTPISRR